MSDRNDAVAMMRMALALLDDVDCHVAACYGQQAIESVLEPVGDEAQVRSTARGETSAAPPPAPRREPSGI